MPVHVVLSGPLQDRATGKLGPILTNITVRLSVDAHQCGQFTGKPSARDAGKGNQAQIPSAAGAIHSEHVDFTGGTKCVERKNSVPNIRHAANPRALAFASPPRARLRPRRRLTPSFFSV